MRNVQIIDKTLVVLYKKYKEKVVNYIEILLELLIKSGVDFIEVPKELNIKSNKVITEGKNKLLINKSKDFNKNLLFDNLTRIEGLNDLFLYDFDEIFRQIYKFTSKDIEIAIKNDFEMGTAATIHWISKYKGRKVVTTFAGIGGYTPLEEVLSALRYICNENSRGDFTNFNKLVNIIKEITGIDIPYNKPILGEEIFSIESGIHVDGVYKDPKNYEPFPPEDVGKERKIVLGKFSGKKAIEIKLKEMNINADKELIIKLLLEVKKKSIALKRGLTEDEFKKMILKGGEKYE